MHVKLGHQSAHIVTKAIDIIGQLTSIFLLAPYLLKVAELSAD